MKAYIDDFDDDQSLYLVRILDAIKDYRHIPGTSPQVENIEPACSAVETGKLKKINILVGKVSTKSQANSLPHVT